MYSSDLSVRCLLLEGLAFFPKDASPKWRVHIFRQAFVSISMDYNEMDDVDKCVCVQ